MSQQLSNKAADTIWNRVVATLNGTVTPHSVLNTTDEVFRQCGVSGSKTQYIKNIARAVQDSTLDLENLPNLTDEQVIAELTKIKGIGRWTAEMFLIFTLGRPDIFSFGDGGLYSAIKKLYNNGQDLTKDQVAKITEQWKPYRSYGSLYLWRNLDNEKK